MCNLNLFECTQSWRRCWWLSGVSISYAGVLNSIGLGPFHQIFRGLRGRGWGGKGECASKYKWTELHLSFSCVWSRGRGAGLNTEFLLSRFLCVSGRGGRSMNQTCHETFHVHPPALLFFFFFFFLFTQMNSSIPRFHAIKCPCLCGRMVQKQVMQKGEIGVYLSSSIAPAFFSSLFISRACLASVCQCVWLSDVMWA